MGRPAGSKNKPKTLEHSSAAEHDEMHTSEFAAPDGSYVSDELRGTRENVPRDTEAAPTPFVELIALKQARFSRGVQLGSDVFESFSPDPQRAIKSVTLVGSTNQDYVKLESRDGKVVLVPATLAVSLIPDAG